MILEKNILSKVEEDLLRERLNAYFTRLGYTPKQSLSSLAFRRGSSLGTWLAISPLEWKAEVLVELKPKSPQRIKVIIIYVIITSGRLVTNLEKAFWSVELDGAISCIRTGELNSAASFRLANDAINQNLHSYLLLGLITVTCGFTGMFILNSWAIAFLLMAAGLAIWFIILRKWQNRKVKG